MVKLLLDINRVDPSSRGKAEKAPLYWAIRKSYKVLVKPLLNTNQVNPDLRNNLEDIRLLIAKRERYHTVDKLLLANNKMPNPKVLPIIDKQMD